jgi:triacylglycerol lipase
MSTSRSRHLVDPELLPMLRFLPPLDLDDSTLASVRALAAANRAAVTFAPDDVEVAIRRIPGPANAPEVAVTIYAPRRRPDVLPAILHMHGGGFVMGSPAARRLAHCKLAVAAQCCIVSVDYRLAPETRFPGALEDCYAALRWLRRQAADLGIDPERIGVMGESAGGGLAAALALLARDRGEHPIACQHLLYPMLDDRTGTRTDPHPFAGEFIWTRANNAYGWSALLGVPPGDEGVSPYAAPARAEDLRGLPPAFIAVGALDLFVDEDVEYARRLTRHGVAVELHVYPGCFHCFDLAAGTRAADLLQRDALAALRRDLRVPA